jgi:anti-sigma factor RsiW
MNSEQAQDVLTLYRPGIGEPADPHTLKALELSRRDPRLSRWLEQRNALYQAIRGGLKQIEAPAGLKERIIAQRPATIIWWQRPVLLAAAATVMLLLGLAGFWLAPRHQDQFAIYRSRMVRAAMGNYTMNLVTNDVAQIRHYLAQHDGHADFVLTKAIEQLPGDGCAIIRWHNRKVSLVCFDLGDKNDLYLFIINRAELPGAPASPQPQFLKVGKLMTASWTAAGKTYVLAGPGDEDALRKFVRSDF